MVSSNQSAHPIGSEKRAGGTIEPAASWRPRTIRSSRRLAHAAAIRGVSSRKSGYYGFLGSSFFGSHGFLQQGLSQPAPHFLQDEQPTFDMARAMTAAIPTTNVVSLRNQLRFIRVLLSETTFCRPHNRAGWGESAEPIRSASGWQARLCLVASWLTQQWALLQSPLPSRLIGVVVFGEPSVV